MCITCVPYVAVSLNCPFWLPLLYSLTFIYLVCPMLWPMFCFFIYLVCPMDFPVIAPSVFSNVYLSRVTYVVSFLDCPFWLPLLYSLTFIYLVCPMLPVSLNCPFWLPLLYSLTFNVYLPVPGCPFCAPSVFLCCQFQFPGLSFLIAPSVFSNVYLSCVPYVASFPELSFLIAPSVFSNVYLSCVPMLFPWPMFVSLWLSTFWLPLLYSLTFIYLVYPMLPVSLDCPFWLPLLYSLTFIYLVLCTLCCQFPWIVLFDCPFCIL